MFAITAAFEERVQKIAPLKKLRIAIEMMKRLLRLMNELSIVKTAPYIDLQDDLQECSKETSNWINYILRESKSS